jgi:putative phosphoesterase
MVSARKRLHLKSGRIGLISDTHGLVRPEALAALKGSELIIHAGDIGKPEVLEALQAVAPLVAIRGNNDRDAWARKMSDILDLKIDGFSIRVIHDVNDLDRAAAAGFHAVISGHSHKPGVITRDGVLFINPGSAGPRRFKLPIAVGRLQFSTGKIRATILNLQV